MTRKELLAILDDHCHSIPAWTENRKRSVLDAMEATYNRAIDDAVDNATVEEVTEGEDTYWRVYRSSLESLKI